MKRGILIVLCSCLVLGVLTLGWISMSLYQQQLDKAEAERMILWTQESERSVEAVDRFCADFWKRENIRPYYESLPRYNASLPSKERLEVDPKGQVSPLVNEMPPEVSGYFLLSPTGLVNTPREDSPLKKLFQDDSSLKETLRNLAANKPKEPEVFAPNETVFSLVPRVDMEPSATAPTRMECEQPALRAYWVDNQLFFLRPLVTNRGVFVQGFLVNLPIMRKMILDLGSDKLLDRHVEERKNALPSVFPLAFIPGEGLAGLKEPEVDTTWYASLVLAWVMSLLAAVLIVYLMINMMSLERKRASFVSAVTHELRTPLTTFTLYTEMLEGGLVPEEKKQEYYAILYRESLRLGHLIDNVLSFARLNQGKPRGMQDVGTGDELFSQLAEKIRPRLEAASFVFQLSIAQQVRVLPIKTDLLSLEQILSNLTDNAIKYGRGESPRVQMTVQMKPRLLLLRFRDHGDGISPDALKNIFTPFSRSAEASAGKLPGVGLGLALSHDVARSLGGELSVESSSSKGTCFLLSLPLG